MSLDNLHDRAVLISADADMVPAVDYLQAHGKNVTHLYFRPLGQSHLPGCCALVGVSAFATGPAARAVNDMRSHACFVADSLVAALN